MALTVAAVRMACSADVDENLSKAEALVGEAAGRGAQVVLLPEMFASRFFSMHDWGSEHFALAGPGHDHPVVRRMATVAAKCGVVLPVSFFERANNAYDNSIMVVDADGSLLGVYRKAHIPLGPPNCFEKYFFNPGDTGFRVWATRHGTIGVGICWDQWFPEAAWIMALGAEALFYPSGIGSDCRDHWLRIMQSHAAANMVPLVVSNRVGRRAGRRDRGGSGGDRGRRHYRVVRSRAHPQAASRLGPLPGSPAGSLRAPADPRRRDLNARRPARNALLAARDRRERNVGSGARLLHTGAAQG